jgi:anti-sigma factor RsiW
MTELSDQLLVAYVDGQLARKQTRAVEKVLDQDDVLAARVDALKHAHARLEAAFEAILAGEEVDVSAASAPVEDGLFIPWSIAKMALAGLGLAAALALAVAGHGWPLSLPGGSPQTALSAAGISGDWQEDAARAQALLSRQSLEVGLESQANYDLVAFQLAHILDANLKFPNLAAQGFRFVRAQMLRYGNAPLIQILYLSARGAPLALYAKKGKGSEMLTPGQYGTIRTVAWAEVGVSYLLAGEVDDALLMRIARRVKLEPAPPLRTAPKPFTPVNSAFDESR